MTDGDKAVLAIEQFEASLARLDEGMRLIERAGEQKDQAIAYLEEALREKDDIIQSQYAELQSTRHRLDQAVDMLKQMQAEMSGKTPA